jgi:hypothetical protein
MSGMRRKSFFSRPRVKDAATLGVARRAGIFGEGKAPGSGCLSGNERPGGYREDERQGERRVKRVKNEFDQRFCPGPGGAEVDGEGVDQLCSGPEPEECNQRQGCPALPVPAGDRRDKGNR